MSEKQENNIIEAPERASQKIVDIAKEQSLEFMNPARWEIMTKMAQVFFQSGALPKSIANVPQLIMVMQAGHEAGLQPIESINSYYFVNGKLSLYGEMAIAQVRRAGHKIKWGECNADTATVTITRGDTGESMTTTFTMKMAEERKLTTNPVYQKYPEDMLKYRAFGMTAKFICPDALHGVPIKEDIEQDVVEPKKEEKPKKKESTKEKTVIEHKPLEVELTEKEKEAQKKLEKKEIKKATAKKKIDPQSPAGLMQKAKEEALQKNKKAENTAVADDDVLNDDTLNNEQKIAKLVKQELDGKKLSEEEIKFINRKQ